VFDLSQSKIHLKKLQCVKENAKFMGINIDLDLNFAHTSNIQDNEPLKIQVAEVAVM